jgi:hypothetical protein
LQRANNQNLVLLLNYPSDACRSTFRQRCRMQLTNFAGTLKQLDTTKLNGDDQSFLNTCFPGFAEEEASKLEGDTRITTFGLHDLRQGRRRRYSGGKYLPRGRYYSVCHSSCGFDNNTLWHELMAYWGVASGISVGVIDSTVPLYADEVRAKYPTTPPGAWLFLQALDVDRFKSGDADASDVNARFLPLKVIDVEIPNVCDLRLRSHQDALAELLSADFSALLPELVNPYRGGNMNHDNIGRRLQRMGANGLVFPSARRNVEVRSSDDAVSFHDGFNFVDFRYPAAEPRDIEEPSSLGLIGGVTWAKVGLQLHGRSDDGSSRTWKIVGAEEREASRMRYEIDNA